MAANPNFPEGVPDRIANPPAPVDFAPNGVPITVLRPRPTNTDPAIPHAGQGGK